MRDWRDRQTASDCCLTIHSSETSLSVRTSCSQELFLPFSLLPFTTSTSTIISYNTLNSRSSTTQIKMSNIGNVIGGHKANLRNPNTSEESKQHSLEVIEKEVGTEANTGTGTTAHNDDGKDPMRVYAA